jgi:hypothetical protein
MAKKENYKKKWALEYYGSRRKVMVAGKWTSRHATVAWQKRRLRKDKTQDSCETACRKVSHHATVAWRKRNLIKFGLK